MCVLYVFLGLIQTVVCFPYLGGVIELGVTELVTLHLSTKGFNISFLASQGTQIYALTCFVVS